MIDQLDDENLGKRRQAATALTVIGTNLDAASLGDLADALIGCLRDKDENVRLDAAVALGRIISRLGLQALEKVANALIREFDETVFACRHFVLETLSEIIPRLAPSKRDGVLDQLIAILSVDEDYDTFNSDREQERSSSAVVLQIVISSLDEPARRRIARVAIEQFGRRRSHSIQRMAEIFQKTSSLLSPAMLDEAAAILIACLTDRQDAMRVAAAESLGAIISGLSPSAFDKTANALMARVIDRPVRVAAARAISQIVTRLDPLVLAKVANRLIGLLEYWDKPNSVAALKALAIIGKSLDASAIEILAAKLTNSRVDSKTKGLVLDALKLLYSSGASVPLIAVGAAAAGH